MTTEENDSSALVRTAVEVINEAIALNRDLRPYKDIVVAYDKPAGKRDIAVAVYTDDPGEPTEYFVLRPREGKLELVAETKEQSAPDWKVARDSLKRIGENRDEYVQHPEKLDLDWLKQCLGVPTALEEEEEAEEGPSRLAREREIEQEKTPETG
jgi:hypothetical protein